MTRRALLLCSSTDGQTRRICERLRLLRKPGKDRPETNPYVRAFLRRVCWRPRRVEVSAGRLDYPRYGAIDRLIIRLIMRMTGGPTRPDAVVEYTDWNRVEAFGRALCADLGLPAAAATAPNTSRDAAALRA